MRQVILQTSDNAAKNELNRKIRQSHLSCCQACACWTCFRGGCLRYLFLLPSVQSDYMKRVLLRPCKQPEARLQKLVNGLGWLVEVWRGCRIRETTFLRGFALRLRWDGCQVARLQSLNEAVLSLGFLGSLSSTHSEKRSIAACPEASIVATALPCMPFSEGLFFRAETSTEVFPEALAGRSQTHIASLPRKCPRHRLRVGDGESAPGHCIHLSFGIGLKISTKLLRPACITPGRLLLPAAI